MKYALGITLAFAVGAMGCTHEVYFEEEIEEVEEEKKVLSPQVKEEENENELGLAEKPEIEIPELAGPPIGPPPACQVGWGDFTAESTCEHFHMGEGREPWICQGNGIDPLDTITDGLPLDCIDSGDAYSNWQYPNTNFWCC